MIEYIVRVTCDRCARVAFDHRPDPDVTVAEDAYAALRAELPGWELHLPDGPHVCETCAGHRASVLASADEGVERWGAVIDRLGKGPQP